MTNDASPATVDPPAVLRLASPDGLELTLMDQGATWLSCRVPLATGVPREVLLGSAQATRHLRQPAYMGATVGRYANRIAHARIACDGRVWALLPHPADSPHQLHGGPDGFDRRRWRIASHDTREATLTLDSPDGDMGFPGQLAVELTYRVAAGPSIEMDCSARTSAPTPVSLTNHAYFNLDATPRDARDHRVRLRASRYLPVDRDLLPLGAPLPVAGSGFDFREPKTVRRDFLRDPQQAPAGGYDHAYLLDPECADLTVPAVELDAGDGRLSLAISTSLPAIQFYSGQLLDGTPGRDGTRYGPCAGLAFEPGFLPDSPNHPEWPQPSCWLLPGQVYRHRIRYRFTAG